MNDSIKRLLVEPFEKFYENVIQYLPNVLGFLLVLIAGFILARVLKILANYLFKLFHVDSVSKRWGITEVLHRGGIREPVSALLARLVEYITIFIFAIVALGVLEIPQVEYLLRDFFIYLPNILVAILILFLGYLLSNFLGRAALITAVNANIPFSGLVGKGVKYSIFALTITMALEQLGIGKETIIIAFTIIFGGVVLALSIAFGLGGRDAAQRYIERSIKKKKQQEEAGADEIEHI
ncbi:MAG: hypothetical protein P8Y66_02280 [Nitrospirota bacterium]|jgi:small-conductance mechanosensitive channel